MDDLTTKMYDICRSYGISPRSVEYIDNFLNLTTHLQVHIPGCSDKLAQALIEAGGDYPVVVVQKARME